MAAFVGRMHACVLPNPIRHSVSCGSICWLCLCLALRFARWSLEYSDWLGSRPCVPSRQGHIYHVVVPESDAVTCAKTLAVVRQLCGCGSTALLKAINQRPEQSIEHSRVYEAHEHSVAVQRETREKKRTTCCRFH